MRKSFYILVFLFIPTLFFGQNDQPKLIVGIVVDQMKPEFLTRYAVNYEEGGFNRMLREGYQCKNTHFNYIPTYTGPGHATIFTGATPSMHGIIANSYYDRILKKKVYCAYDPEVTQTEGNEEGGKMSASRILTTTIGDEMKLANPNSKVVAISEKDRASTFPAGHNADGAYWLVGHDFITSTAYKIKLPKWVKDFNNEKLVGKYLSKEWDLLLPKVNYQTLLDDSPYEGTFSGEKSPVFPHDIPSIYANDENAGLIKATPYGNSITVDMAIAAIEGEKLGVDDDMDLLCISFSSTDYVGHDYGTHAIETEDTYYRLDKDLSRLFSYLDKQIGVGTYTVFLTSDHGAAVPPGLLKEQNIPAGYFDTEPLKQDLDSLLDKRFIDGDWIVNMTDNYIWLNEELMEENKLNRIDVYRWIKNYLVQQEGIHMAYDRISLMENDYSDWLGSKVKNGFNAKYSPDIIYLLSPGYIDYGKVGTTHGSGYTYDTHAPLLWMGFGIEKGHMESPSSITDIVPTLCTKFKIPLPSGCMGTPLLLE
ncbi:MAG: putative AlkP superfamily pyrophosphatase or phosphodiesterase [Patiriisocius sp.]|jgi:predicted AlkP superfamily pyrophosphatase or phosphodiesterase